MIKTRDIFIVSVILLGFWVAGFVIKANGLSAPLSVNSNYAMQPFGKGAEDDVRAEDTLQPTYLGVQVTLNGQFIQGSRPELQGKQ